MPDPVKPQDGAGAGDGGQQGGEADPVTARLEKLEGLLTGFGSTLQGFEKKLNFAAAGARAQGKTTQKTEESSQTTEQETLTLKSLQEQYKADREVRDQKLRDKAIRTEIRSFAKNNQISPEGLPFFEAFIEKTYKGKLSTDDNDEVVYQDEFGETHPFEALGKKILAGAGGQSFLAPVDTPGSTGQRTKDGVVQNRAGGKSLNDMSDDEKLTLFQKSPDQGREMLRQAMIASNQGRTIRT